MKKWSYAAAMILAVSGGSVLTGCIDNDEPYGIEQVRLATANLLEAKKAALEADAAATAAKTELEKLQIELEKARIENEKIAAEAAAKYQEALGQAEIKRAEAEAAKTQAEANRIQAEADKLTAEAEQQKAETEMYLKRQNAEIDDMIAQAQVKLDQSKLWYEKAVYAFEQKKAQNALNANNSLWWYTQDAFGKYLIYLDAYNTANKDYLDKLKQYQEYNLSLVWDDDTQKWYYPREAKENALNTALTQAQAEVKKNQIDVDNLTELLSKLNEVEASELSTTLEEYKGKYQDAQVALTEAQVALEKAKIDNKDITDKPAQIQDEMKALLKEIIDIPAYTFKVKETDALAQIAPLSPSTSATAPNVVNGYYEYEIVGKNTSYQLDAAGLSLPTTTNPAAYTTAKGKYDDIIDALKQLQVDDNDEVWAAAQLTELGRVIPASAANAVAGWEKAKATYNNGGVPKPAEAEGAEDVSDAIQKVVDTQNAVVTAKKNYVAAWLDYLAKDAAYKALTATPAPTPAPTQAQLDAAENAAKEAAVKYGDPSALLDYGVTADPAKDTQLKFNDAVIELANAQSDLQVAYTDQARDCQFTVAAVNVINPTLAQSISDLGDVKQDADGKPLAVDKQYVTVVTPIAPLSYCDANKVYVNANEYIKAFSVLTFGNMAAYDSQNFIQVTEMLIGANEKYNFADPLKSEKGILAFFNDYLAKLKVTSGTVTDYVKPWNFKNYYNNTTFGYYGAILDKLYTYNLCGFVKKGGSLKTEVNAFLAPQSELMTNYNNLVDTYTAQVDKYNELKAEKDKAELAKNNALKEAEAAVADATSYLESIENIVADLQNGVDCIANIINGNTNIAPSYDTTTGVFTGMAITNPDETLKGIIANKEQALAAAEELLANAQQLLADAQAALDAYNSDEYKEIANPYANQLQRKKDALAKAEAEKDFWWNRYKYLEEAYQNATGQNSTEE